MKKPLALIILDGFGCNSEVNGNAIKAAKTPNLDKIFATSPITQIGASGMDVGLPDGQMGNSEVGHTNIGAGRIVYQELTRITKSIKDGDFYQNETLKQAVAHALKNHSALHVMGLLSDGGVHSHNEHLYAVIKMAHDAGVKNIFVHCFMDGRDVPPSSGADFIKALDAKLTEIGGGKIATIMGRYFAMDRDNNFDRVQKAHDAMVLGQGDHLDPLQVMPASYEHQITDEFVVPAVCTPDGKIKDGDSVVFANFRPDRAREITRTLVDPEFNGFSRQLLNDLYFVCMTQYDATMPGVHVAFKPQSLENTFGQYISANGLTQLRIAETEKYAHVTFFFNGGVEATYPGEDRALIASPKVATYDMQPEMSAPAVTEEMLKRIASEQYDVIILNYANCDMVGHTGVFEAAVAAVEAVDAGVGQVVDAILAKGGIALITADHGNADKMYDTDGSAFTAHTTNPVPFVVVGKDCTLRSGGCLADIAPTMLSILGLEQPEQMTGKTLIEN